MLEKLLESDFPSYLAHLLRVINPPKNCFNSIYPFYLFETSIFIEFKFSHAFLTTLRFSLMHYQLLSISSVQCRLWRYKQKHAKIWTALYQQISWICAETKKFFRRFTACNHSALVPLLKCKNRSFTRFGLSLPIIRYNAWAYTAYKKTTSIVSWALSQKLRTTQWLSTCVFIL